MPGRSRNRLSLSTRRRVAFLAIVAAALVLSLEVGVRAVQWVQAERLERRWSELEGNDVAEPGARVKLGAILKPSDDPEVIYELVPKLDVSFLRKPMRTNASGFRGADYPYPKPPDTVRVVGLGDSVMFGWGVGEGETYLEFLKGGLEAAVPQLAWEIVNTAVPGYNTAMEVAVLESKGLAYEPDLVIINFVGNDFELPNFIPREESFLALDRSHLWDLLSGRTRVDPRSEKDEWRRVFMDSPRRKDRYDWKPESVPERYRHQVGHEGYRRAMRRLAELRDEHGFLLLILGHPGVYEIVDEVALELDIPVVTTLDHFRIGIQHNQLEGLRDPSLIVAPNDSHPAARGHAWISQVLFQHLKESGALEELVRRRATPATLRELGLAPATR